MNAGMRLRAAVPNDIEGLANIWHDGWHEAHAAHVPAELTKLRTLESFADRLSKMLDRTTVCEVSGKPIGFCTLNGDELMQLFVDQKDRGTGAADMLLKDGERRLAAAGFETAWLACVIGNTHAERFYLRSGWELAGRMTYQGETQAGAFPIEVWRLEKRL